VDRGRGEHNPPHPSAQSREWGKLYPGLMRLPSPGLSVFLVLAVACTPASVPVLPSAEASSCGSISNNDLRYLCGTGRKYPGCF